MAWANEYANANMAGCHPPTGGLEGRSPPSTIRASGVYGGAVSLFAEKGFHAVYRPGATREVDGQSQTIEKPQFFDGMTQATLPLRIQAWVVFTYTRFFRRPLRARVVWVTTMGIA